MKEVNLNFDINDLEGKSIGNAGKSVANVLVSSTSGDALKYYDWAVKLHKGESINLDASDFKKVCDFIENSQSITIIAKVPIMNHLNSLK